jgi:hypothetical protein
MEKDTTTYVGPDDSKRKLVVAILRPGELEPMRARLHLRLTIRLAVASARKRFKTFRASPQCRARLGRVRAGLPCAGPRFAGTPRRTAQRTV